MLGYCTGIETGAGKMGAVKHREAKEKTLKLVKWRVSTMHNCKLEGMITL